MTTEINENVLLGEWTLDKLTCYDSEQKNSIVEKYDIGATTNVWIKFEGNNITYEVSGSCTTSAYGRYRTDFDGDSKGEIDFFNLITGSTCDISFNDIGPNTVGSVSVNLTLLETESEDLDWLYDSNDLDLELGTGFKGSSSTSGCIGACYCVGAFEKS